MAEEKGEGVGEIECRLEEEEPGGASKGERRCV